MRFDQIRRGTAKLVTLLFAGLLSVSCFVALSGCETVGGAGEDISGAAQETEEAVFD